MCPPIVYFQCDSQSDPITACQTHHFSLKTLQSSSCLSFLTEQKLEDLQILYSLYYLQDSTQSIPPSTPTTLLMRHPLFFTAPFPPRPSSIAPLTYTLGFFSLPGPSESICLKHVSLSYSFLSQLLQVFAPMSPLSKAFSYHLIQNYTFSTSAPRTIYFPFQLYFFSVLFIVLITTYCILLVYCFSSPSAPNTTWHMASAQ